MFERPRFTLYIHTFPSSRGATFPSSLSPSSHLWKRSTRPDISPRGDFERENQDQALVIFLTISLFSLYSPRARKRIEEYPLAVRVAICLKIYHPTLPRLVRRGWRKATPPPSLLLNFGSGADIARIIL